MLESWDIYFFQTKEGAQKFLLYHTIKGQEYSQISQYISFFIFSNQQATADQVQRCNWPQAVVAGVK